MPPFKKVKRSPSNQKPNIGAEESEIQDSEPSSTLPSHPPAEEQGLAVSKDQAAATTEDVQQKSVNPRRSWYGGTWPRTPVKTPPISQLATETISVSGEVAAKGAEKAKSIAGSLKGSSRPPSIYMSPGIPSRSLPATASTSRVNVSTPKTGATSSEDLMDIDGTQEKSKGIRQDQADSHESESHQSKTQPTSVESAGTPSSWRGWIPGYRTVHSPAAAPVMGDDKAEFKDSDKAKMEDGKSSKGEAETTAMSGVESTSDQTTVLPKQVEDNTQRPRSWFGLWNGDTNVKGESVNQVLEGNVEPAASGNVADSKASTNSGTQIAGPEVSPPATESSTKQPEGIDTPSSWSFWPRGSAAAPKNGLSDAESAKGESSRKSQAKSSSEGKNATNSEAVKSLVSSRKRERTDSVDIPTAGVAQEDKISKQSPDGQTSASAAIDVLPAGSDEKPPPRKQQPTSNLLLPSLRQTLRAADNPGLLSRLASYFYSSKNTPARHVNLVSDPPKIKHALAIGVHGYFPAPFIRSVIGKPRGTSVRFATNAEEAIAEWGRKHGCSPKIDKIALEGEGRIEERIELLWQLLLKHIDKVQEADFILVACHSQGVPVAVHLVAKLVGFGCLGSVRVGICAMAGVSQGPFAEYKSRWIGGSAGELFDFASPSSKVSMDYEVALNTVLKSGIKIVFVGSIDDQLVSMESATFGNAEHPGLFRAVFINGQVHAPTFLVHLVGFALKLRNLGIPDHGLIRELSNSLSGSFTGDGHSRLYEDPQLYDTAIEFALETTAIADVPLSVKKGPSTGSQNPYILPFAMRGVLEEDFVKSELRSEMFELLQQFDEWKPVTKPLKDVKFRLEGVRSKI